MTKRWSPRASRRFAVHAALLGRLVGATCAIALGLLLNTFPSGAAHAALLCSSGSLIGIGTCTETVSSAGVGADSANVQLFLDQWTSNAAAGLTETLTNVQFSGGGNVNLSGSLTNHGAQTSTLSFSQSEALTFTAGPGSPNNFLTVPLVANGSTSVAPVKLAPGATFSFGGGGINYAVGPSAPVNVNTSLGQFIGAGTFQALAATSTSSGLTSNGGNAGPNTSTSATPQIQVEYDFQNVASGGALAGPGNGSFICTAGNVAGAGSCIKTYSFGPATTDLANALTLDKFQSNAAAGFSETLTHAKFTLSGSIHSDGSLTNNGTQTATVGLGLSDAMTFSAGTGAPSNFLTAPVVVNGNGSAASGALAAGASAPYTMDFALGPAPTLDLASDLSAFLGSGTFDADFATATDATLTTSGGDTPGINTDISPSMTLTYTFDNEVTGGVTVPEPATLALFGVGLAGLGIIRRRRAA